jgi:hypothetical protein
MRGNQVPTFDLLASLTKASLPILPRTILTQTGYFLADLFRSELRKQRLTREIDCQCQGLLVIDAHDVEALRVSNSNSTFDLLNYIFERSRHGDVVYDFHDFMIDYANKNGISLKSDAVMDSKVHFIFDRISKRSSDRPLPSPPPLDRLVRPNCSFR